MTKTFYFLLALAVLAFACNQNRRESGILEQITAVPSEQEISDAIDEVRLRELSPRDVIIRDSTVLSNGNTLYVVSHSVEGFDHYGAVIIPQQRFPSLPVMIFATGGDGIHEAFDITDFDHDAVQFPDFIGGGLDQQFIVVIPSFRGQRLIIGKREYQSGGSLNDAFDGAASDAIALLNVALERFQPADANRIGIYGGSRGGTVAMLVAVRDSRIKGAVVIAAPSEMKRLSELFPDQFELLFLNKNRNGHLPSAEARRRILLCSPMNFAGDLPYLQMHYDLGDPFVSPDFATTLSNEMVAKKKIHELYFYNENDHGYPADPMFSERVQQFARRLRDGQLKR